MGWLAGARDLAFDPMKSRCLCGVWAVLLSVTGCGSDEARKFSNSGGSAGSSSGGSAGSSSGGSAGSSSGGNAGSSSGGTAGSGSGGTAGANTGGTGATGTGGAAPTPTVVTPAVYAESLVEVAGTLYWTEAGTNPDYKDSKVRKFTAAGGATDLATAPEGRFLRLVHSNGALIWANYGTITGPQGTVESIKTDGSGQKSLATKVSTATGIALIGSKIYFTRNSTSGEVVEIDGTNVTPVFTNQSQPDAIAAAGSTLYWGNYDKPGALMKGAPGAVASPIAALDYITAIEATAADLFVAHDGGVSKLNLNGVGSVILSDKQVNDIAVNATHLYLTSGDGNVVVRAKLDGSERTELVTSAPGQPKGLALTPTTLYWTEYAGLGRIMRLDVK